MILFNIDAIYRCQRRQVQSSHGVVQHRLEQYQRSQDHAAFRPPFPRHPRDYHPTTCIQHRIPILRMDPREDCCDNDHANVQSCYTATKLRQLSWISCGCVDLSIKITYHTCFALDFERTRGIIQSRIKNRAPGEALIFRWRCQSATLELDRV